ncbi:RNHCP domain-containing protein [Prescottella agglutinans]|uniref:RNHCP domain-containing protein n=1 Tax=Prescottella agglutinans TaxID=1644129 RepID=A0A438B8L3_9NOCA|nr:RNHCP domain-containing protein [Prescottella agglutinans]RVW07318.1 RNHCP domain-containing protein [Prescottella agglutinans]
MSSSGTPISHLSTFTCIRCGLAVSVAAPSAEPRTHCPNCLTGTHGQCRARTHPIAVAVLRDGDWMLIHRCTGCDHLAAHPVVDDDNQLLLIRIAVKPLAQPPFPLEHLAQL